MKRYEDVLDDLIHMSKKVFPKENHQIEEKARILYDGYCKLEAGKPKEITMHTVKKIYPCIAFYKAVIEITNQREQAYFLIEKYFAEQCEIYAKKLQKLCHIPFVYMLVPKIMATVIHRNFGVKSGFEMIDYKTKYNTCHIDMTKCPYFSACSTNGCPELTTAFCNSDDIAYGNMHPKLSWERKKTLGRGDNCCDFILRIKSNTKMDNEIGGITQ